MEKGDLSGKVSPRCLIIFEDGLGFCRDTTRSKKLRAKGRIARELAECWLLNEAVATRMLWLFHKKDVAFEVVTFISEEFAVELRHWLDSLDIPVHRVWATTPAALGRAIAYMPDLAYVYDPDPERWLMYGSKGVYLDDARQIGSFFNG